MDEFRGNTKFSFCLIDQTSGFLMTTWVISRVKSKPIRFARSEFYRHPVMDLMTALIAVMNDGRDDK